MNSDQAKSKSSTLTYEELEQRLATLTYNNREAAAVFSARSALRALPLTIVNGSYEYWQKNQHDYVQHIFIAAIVGLDYSKNHIIVGNNIAAIIERIADNTELPSFVYQAIISAYYSAYVDYPANSAAKAVHSVDQAFTYHSNIDHTNHTFSPTAPAYIQDLIQLEQGKILSVKQSPLWWDSMPSEVTKLIEEWGAAMSALKLDLQVKIYSDLLLGKYYPESEIQNIISAWKNQFSDLINPEGNEQGKESVRYDQHHTSMADMLAERDSLGRQKLVDAMVEILAAKENTQHQTIGLLGDWGAGKSTFVKLLKSSLQQKTQAQFLFAEFNAWEYEHTDNMQAGVAREALKGLTDDLGWWKKFILTLRFSWQERPWRMFVTLSFTIVLLFGSLSELVWSNIFKPSLGDILQPIIAAIGLGSAVLILVKFFHSLQKLFKSPLVNEWKSYLSLPDYDIYLGTIPVMKRQIRALCRLRLNLDRPHSEQKRLLFVVDDLDRCSHAGVVKTLEAVRLIMGISQVIVIIAIDQRIALASLALHYKELADYYQEGDPGSIARDYLGKVIQLPVQLRAADGPTINEFVDRVLLNRDTVQSSELVSQSNKDGVTDKKETPTSKEQHKQDSDVQKEELPDNKKESEGKFRKAEKIEYKLSPIEESAFKDRVQKFNFHNPRQLKRLYNSFNLLRHLYGSDRVDDHMLMLFWLEYLNNLPAEKRADAGKSGEIRTFVRSCFENDDTRYADIECQVKPFVLPALDKIFGKTILNPKNL